MFITIRVIQITSVLAQLKYKNALLKHQSDFCCIFKYQRQNSLSEKLMNNDLGLYELATVKEGVKNYSKSRSEVI